MDFLLNERHKTVLYAVVQNYIQTADPVGSRTVAKRSGLNLSPATIRNVMSDLEEMDLLRQPHTSAGRLPTELGLRYYVDSLVEIHPISSREMEVINEEFSASALQNDQLAKTASKILSLTSKNIGIVRAPRFSQLVLKRLEFILLSKHVLSSILVTKSGIVHNRNFEVDYEITSDEVNRFNNYLNDILEGLTIEQVKQKIMHEQKSEKTKFDKMISKALTLSRKVFEQELGEDDVYIQGHDHLFDYPEFAANMETLKYLFKTFEEKKLLVKLLDKIMSSDDVQIIIGSENEIAEMQGWTMVASAYGRESVPMGTVGVLGPTRLNYAKVIPLVDYTAKALSRNLENARNKDEFGV